MSCSCSTPGCASGLDNHQDRVGEASAGKLKFWGWGVERFAADFQTFHHKTPWFHGEIKAFAGESGGSHDWDVKNTVLWSLWPSQHLGWDLPKENQYGQKASPDVFSMLGNFGLSSQNSGMFWDWIFLGHDMFFLYIDQCTESWFLCFPWLAFSRAFLQCVKGPPQSLHEEFPHIPMCLSWYMNYFAPDTGVYPVVLVLYLPKRHVKSTISTLNLFFWGKRMHFIYYKRHLAVCCTAGLPPTSLKAFCCGWSGRNLVWGAQRLIPVIPHQPVVKTGLGLE